MTYITKEGQDYINQLLDHWNEFGDDQIDFSAIPCDPRPIQDVELKPEPSARIFDISAERARRNK